MQKKCLQKLNVDGAQGHFQNNRRALQKNLVNFRKNIAHFRSCRFLFTIFFSRRTLQCNFTQVLEKCHKEMTIYVYLQRGLSNKSSLTASTLWRVEVRLSRMSNEIVKRSYMVSSLEASITKYHSWLQICRNYTNLKSAVWVVKLKKKLSSQDVKDSEGNKTSSISACFEAFWGPWFKAKFVACA